MSAAPRTDGTDPVAALADVLWDSGALVLGDLVTRSGRPTPYFVDLGRVHRGPVLARLAELYADAIAGAFGREVDVLFGPAYKGIPLAVAAGLALAARGQDVGVAFDRKEAKDHGEGGRLVGAPLTDGTRVVIVEDVTTAGTSVRATVPLLRAAADVEVVGLVVAVDRRERGTRADRSALEDLADEFGLRTVAIATIDDVIDRLGRRTGPEGRPLVGPDDHERIARYRAAYGVIAEPGA